MTRSTGRRDLGSALTSTFLAAGLLVTAACGGPKDAASHGPALDCGRLALADSSALPLDTVRVSGVFPARDPAPVVRARAPGDTLSSPFRLLRLAEGRTGLLVTVHPSGRIEGGPVRLTFRAGDRTCDPIPFTVEALEPAPGEMLRTADAVVDLAATEARLLGTTPSALRSADPDTLLPPLKGLALQQGLVAELGEIRPMLEETGRGPSAPWHGRTVRLMDALVARSALTEGLRDLDGEMAHLATGASVSSTAYSSGPPYVWWASRRHAPAPPAAATTPFPRTLAEFRDPEAQELSRWMSIAYDADVATSGRAAVYFELLRLDLSVGAAIPNAAGKVYKALGYVALVYKVGADALAHTLPREFTDQSLRLELDPARFEEDDPGPGAYRVYATARSLGWDVDDDIIDVLLSLASEGGGFKSLHSKLDLGTADEEMRQFFENLFDLEAMTGLSKLLGDFSAAEGGLVRIPAMTFGPVDLTDDAWTEARFTGGPAVQRMKRPAYRPVRTGETLLQVWTKPLKFGDQHAEGRATIRVDPIEVRVHPTRAVVKPGESRTFRASVEHAMDREVTWDIRPHGANVLIVTGKDRRTADVTVSSHPGDLPARVVARSVADRSHLAVAPVRIGVGRLVGDRLAVQPGGTCVEPAASVHFEARFPTTERNVGDVVFENGTVRWAASAGEISSEGGFTAPSSTGGFEDAPIVKITATSADDPEVTGDARVRVGGCTCWSHVEVGPPLSRSLDGTAAFSRDGGVPGPGGVPWGTWGEGEGDGGLVFTNSTRNAFSHGFQTPNAPVTSVMSRHFTVSLAATLPPSPWTGAVEIGAGAVIVGRRSYAGLDRSSSLYRSAAFGENQGGGGTLTITRNTDAVVEGTVAATFVAHRREGDAFATIDIPFHGWFRAVKGSALDAGSDYARCVSAP